MKEILNRLINQETISKEEAKKVLVNISKGVYNTSQIASFLTVYMMRSISVEELDGFREALLDLCLSIDISDFNAVNGQFAIAGQNSLFCVHATTANNTAFPIITKVNTTTLSFHTFSTSEGSMLDASNRLTVISDDQVMFSEMATDSFYEYYIDVVNRAEEAMVVTEASIVGLQTLD